MDNDIWTKLGIAISVLWLILCIARLGLYSSFYAGTPQGETFVTILNVLLIIGVVMIALILGKRLLRYSAAKTMKGSHCQQCYAKLEPGSTFCPVCGWEKPKE